MTALSRYNANMEGEIEPDSIERLRFFLSLALTGQDWLDVEQFIDGVSQQLTERDAEVTSLTNQRDYEFVRAENLLIERDQLHEQVKMLRALCTEGANGFGRILISTSDDVAVRDWQTRCKEALDATEQKEKGK